MEVWIRNESQSIYKACCMPGVKQEEQVSVQKGLPCLSLLALLSRLACNKNVHRERKLAINWHLIIQLLLGKVACREEGKMKMSRPKHKLPSWSYRYQTITHEMVSWWWISLKNEKHGIGSALMPKSLTYTEWQLFYTAVFTTAVWNIYAARLMAQEWNVVSPIMPVATMAHIGVRYQVNIIDINSNAGILNTGKLNVLCV